MDHRPYTNRPQYTRTRCRRQLPWHQLSRSCRQQKPVKCSCRCLLKKSCWRSLVNCWMMRIQNWKKPEIQYTHPDQAIRNLNLQGQSCKPGPGSESTTEPDSDCRCASPGCRCCRQHWSSRRAASRKYRCWEWSWSCSIHCWVLSWSWTMECRRHCRNLRRYTDRNLQQHPLPSRAARCCTQCVYQCVAASIQCEWKPTPDQQDLTRESAPGHSNAAADCDRSLLW